MSWPRNIPAAGATSPIRKPGDAGWRIALAVFFATFAIGCAAQESSGQSSVADAETEVNPATQLPEPSAETRMADRSDARIRIAAVGDMMLGTNYPENRLPDDDGNSFLSAVAPILSAADLAIGNMEGVLVDGGTPQKECSSPRSCYLFRSPTRYAKHYKDAGFDALSVANNHARDFGDDGRLSSMKALASVDIRHSGLEGDFATMNINDLRVAFLAYSVTQKSNLLHDYDVARATAEEFAATHDVVVVSFHGGAEGQNVLHLPFAEEEYFSEPRGDVVRFGRMMVDAGADLVVGHGPHVVRAMEVYKDRLIAYSLGNFATYYGISVEGNKGIAPILDVSLDGNGKFLGGKIHSTVQLRPHGPSIDDEQRVLELVRTLSEEDFGTPGLRFGDDGSIEPIPRVMPE